VSALREAFHVAGRFAGNPIGTTSDAVKFAKSLRAGPDSAGRAHSPALTAADPVIGWNTFDVAFR